MSTFSLIIQANCFLLFQRHHRRTDTNEGMLYLVKTSGTNLSRSCTTWELEHKCLQQYWKLKNRKEKHRQGDLWEPISVHCSFQPSLFPLWGFMIQSHPINVLNTSVSHMLGLIYISPILGRSVLIENVVPTNQTKSLAIYLR